MHMKYIEIFIFIYMGVDTQLWLISGWGAQIWPNVTPGSRADAKPEIIHHFPSNDFAVAPKYYTKSCFLSFCKIIKIIHHIT